MTHRPDLSVIIVSYNTRDLTIQTVGTLLKSTKKPLEIIVVDNASSDGSADALRAAFPEIRVFAETKNLGFGKANNLGAHHATAEILYFLNSDVIMNPTSVDPLYDYLIEHPKAGIIAPKLLLEDGKTMQQAAFGQEPTLMNLLLRQQQRHDSSHTDSQTHVVDWVTGAAFLMRRDLFLVVGGFDEALFMYYEDIDLCHRVRDAGYSIIWNPSATLVHLGGKSSISTWRRKRLYYASQIYYMKKHYGSLIATILWCARLPLVVYYRLKG
ncbi:MAG TPA: glycosyltransferase family 2 protein [Patescibacteria group bacterium]